MKLFWAMIAVLVLVGVGFLLLSGPQQRAAERDIARARDEAVPQPPQTTPPERPASPPPPKLADTPLAEVPATPTPSVAPSPAPASSKPEPSIDDLLVALPIITPASTTATGNAAATASLPPKAPAKPEDPTFDILPTSIAQQDDGTSLVDGKYTIKGDGSADNPYVVPWELLTSAEHTYNPAEGKKKISEAITMLDGKHVKLSGFIAFPMMVQQPRELLSMLNQWDGCCIGVPPTPYDAVEVRLKDKVTGQKRFMTAGNIVGIFRVKPYLTGKWLVGLWIMDDGEIVNEKYGAGGT